MKDILKQWLDKAKLGPNQAKLVERLTEQVKDDEDAGLLNEVLDIISGKNEK